MSGRVVLILITCIAVPSAYAQDKPVADAESASAPETSAEEKALRSALKGLSIALQDGDGKAIHHAIYAANATER